MTIFNTLLGSLTVQMKYVSHWVLKWIFWVRISIYVFCFFPRVSHIWTTFFKILKNEIYRQEVCVLFKGGGVWRGSFLKCNWRIHQWNLNLNYTLSAILEVAQGACLRSSMWDMSRNTGKWKWKSLNRVQLFATPWTVHRILHARILEWVAYPFSRGSSWPRNWTGVSCIAGGFFTNWAIRDAHRNTGDLV